MSDRRPCHCTGCGGRRGADAAPGWHDSKGPAPLLHALHGRSNPIPGEQPARWVDHAYRLRQPDGSWIYVAEPYSLGDALADLVHLEASGYDVQITAEAARHYPGHTIAVRIREAAS